MKRKILCNIIFSFFLIFTFYKTSHSQIATARFLLWNPSAASMAKAGVGVSFYENATSAYFNPANLSELQQINITGTYVKPMPFFENIVHSYIASVFQIPKVGYFAISGNLFWKVKQVILNNESYLMEKIGKDYLFSWQAKLSYAFNLKEWLAVGIGIGYLHYHLSDIEIGVNSSKGISNTILFDIGLLAKNLFKNATIKVRKKDLPDYVEKYTLPINKKGINIGISISNLGPSISMLDKSQSDPLPLKLLIGGTYWLLSDDFISLILFTESEMHLYEEKVFQYNRVSYEITLLRFFSFRNGYVFTMDKRRNPFPTWGVGLKFKFFSLNISRYKYTIKPSWHYSSVFQWKF